MASGALLPPTDYVLAQQFRRQLLAEFTVVFQSVDAVVDPTVAWTTPKEDSVVADGEGSAEAFRTAPLNLNGLRP